MFQLKLWVANSLPIRRKNFRVNRFLYSQTEDRRQVRHHDEVETKFPLILHSAHYINPVDNY